MQISILAFVKYSNISLFDFQEYPPPYYLDPRLLSTEGYIYQDRLLATQE